MKKPVVTRINVSETPWTDLRVMLMFGCFAVSAVMAYAAAPAWWGARGLIKPGITANDYSVANQGQLKNMARAACDELLAKGYIDTSHAIYQQVQNWRTTTANAKDYGAVNLGQLKAVAKPFYDVLKAQDASVNYPWSTATTDDKDYGIANIGQLKNVFAFAIPDLLQKPAGMSASHIMPRSVTLTWQDNNTAEDGYRIERSLDNTTFAPLVTLAANLTTYTDSGSGVSRNTDYYYRILALRGTNSSAPSDVAHAKTPQDTDDDGIPDAWETLWGLNPSYSGDSSQTLNVGGPTMLQNYQRWAGLDPDGDEDGDHILNSQDADPFDSTKGILTISITAPASTTTF